MTQMLCGFCKGPLVLNWCPACEAIVEEDAQDAPVPQQKGEKMPTFEGRADYRVRLIEVAQALGYDASIVDNESCNALAHSVKTLAENYARLFATPPALEKLRDSIALALSHLEGQRVFSAAEILQAVLAELEPKAPPPRTCQEEQD